jgi:hypothetical protein
MKLSHEPSKDKLYYLAHPFHTYGSPDINRSLAHIAGRKLDRMGIHYINPLLTIPPNTPEPVATEKCGCLLMACDGIILCENWRKSKGCLHERIFAEKLGLEILEIEEG